MKLVVAKWHGMADRYFVNDSSDWTVTRGKATKFPDEVASDLANHFNEGSKKAKQSYIDQFGSYVEKVITEDP